MGWLGTPRGGGSFRFQRFGFLQRQKWPIGNTTITLGLHSLFLLVRCTRNNDQTPSWATMQKLQRHTLPRSPPIRRGAASDQSFWTICLDLRSLLRVAK